MQKIHLRRTKRLLGGHLWVFSNEIHENLRLYEPGSLVTVYDMKEGFLGIGYINPKSLIAVRILTRLKEEINKEFFIGRIKDAIGLRERLLGKRDAMRLIFSEADFLPGLIVDKYGKCLVIQILTAGMEAIKSEITEILDGLLNPEAIILRNDSPIRQLEGLLLYKEVLKGNVETLPVIEEDGVRFEIDPYHGQKTGFFLDQRENRIALRRFVNTGGKGLDLFSYEGAWAMHLAKEGAEVICVDESERALKQAERNAGLNNLTDKVQVIKADVFSFLKEEVSKGEGRYDFIVLDPPSFVKSKDRIKEAVKAYRVLNSLCMRLIKPGGVVASSTCSYHMSREMFLDMLNDSARDAGKDARLLSLRSQGPDHPVLLSMPETEYLKCAFLLVG